ncbi:MAG: ATP-grasp domain-containing protein, partial [Vicinamibacteria bacterium]
RFIAEELLRGELSSVDGFVCRGDVRVMGIVDAVMYAQTRSFERFCYPSRLPSPIQERMSVLAIQVIRGIGYDNGMFNIEMMYDARRDSIHVVEINPRMSVQFSDLFEKVDGTSGYDVHLMLASGREPVFRKGRGRHAVAASFILRVFEDRLVLRIPRPAEVEPLRVAFPDLRLRWFCREGRRLSRDPQDAESYRLGFVNLGANDDEELSRRFDRARSTLRVVLAST